MTEKKPQPAFREDQVFLTAVLEQVEDAIVACNSEGVLTLFNRAAREIHGLPEEPIPAEQWAEYYDLFLPDGETRMRAEEVPLFRALGGEHVRDVEMVVAPKGAASRTLLASAHPLTGPRGEKLGAIAVMHDITERKRAQETLRRESSLLQALMDNIPDAIYFKDTESRFTRVNRHAPYRGGKDPADVIGKTDFDFFVEEHARAAYEDEQRIMRTGQPILDKVELETYPDGSVTWLSTTKVPILDEDGKVTGLVGISRDITERKRAEEERLRLAREQAAREEAEAANRSKDEFLAVLSHELRTPLTAVLGWAHLLRDGRLDEKTAADALETIERSARAQARLVDDLLDVSRIITGKLRLEVSQVEPRSFIESAIEAVRPAAAAKEVTIQNLTGADQGSIAGDAARLKQIAWNLLANAIKFTPQGGRIEVRLRRAGPHVEFAVTDTGAGISPEFLPHVFEPFRQADQKTTRRHGGLGLGLSIVRHLVDLHGGTVHAESPGEGRGATFTVRLPASDARQTDSPGERAASAAGDAPATHGCPERFDGLKVLVVDDEVDTRTLLKMAVGRCGAEVLTAGSVREALEAVEAERPDVLISDIGMPDEDGYDLIRRVRGLPAESGGGVPAIALTAYARDEDRAQALAAGYQMHVAKPVDMAQLIKAVANLIRLTNQGD
ncbi:MAG TPA: PAS domain-containing protein [Pyrinomonadaceae bacterium]|nr:PAS domain-containing protein [Pyrinomonadaceae bacterium]